MEYRKREIYTDMETALFPGVRLCVCLFLLLGILKSYIIGTDVLKWD